MRVYPYTVHRSTFMTTRTESASASLLPALRSHLWFASCAPAFQQALLVLGRLHHLEAGETLFVRGDDDAGLCCVVAGAVRLGSINPRNGAQRLLMYLEPYHWFGEVTVIDRQPRAQDAVADLDSIVLVVPRSRLEPWLDAHPAHWRDLSRLACSKLRLMLAAAEDHATLPVEQQLARRLVLAVSNFGQTTPAHWRRRVRLPQEYLASMLGVSRQTVNKALRALEREGLLRLGYAELEIVDLAGLVARAGDLEMDALTAGFAELAVPTALPGGEALR